MTNNLTSHVLSFKSAAHLAKEDAKRWKKDSQPERLTTPQQYIDLAQNLTQPSLAFAADILISAGYICASKKDEAVEALRSLKSKKSFDLDGVSVQWRIKSERSAEDKIRKDVKKPDQIGDYFGIKFVGKTVSDIVRLRDAVVAADNLTSKKCEFTYPSERGYRSHKSHHIVDDGDFQLSLEAIITHADFESVDFITHGLIDLERRILERQHTSEIIDHKLSGKFARAASDMKAFRTHINHQTAAAAGLNLLCADDAKIPSDGIGDLDDWTVKMAAHAILPRMTVEGPVADEIRRALH